MKLKTDEQGHVVVSEGKPVFVGDDGRETAFDVVATLASIKRLNAEAKGHREAKEAAEIALKDFEGIDDPAAARKAVETLRNLDAKKLIDAGEVDKVKAEAEKAFEARLKGFEERLAPLQKANDRLQAQLYAEKVGGSFDRSTFIRDKLAIPPDIARARFGEQFKIENDAIIAYDRSGNKIYSDASPGDPAGFDEALAKIVEAYPYRDQIMKGTGASGSGAAGAGGAGGGRSLPRAAFIKLPPHEQMAHVKAGGAITD